MSAFRRVWIDTVAWVAVSRLIIFVIGVVGIASFANQETGLVTSGLAALNPVNAWHKWDSLWYERIALHGYGYQIDDVKGQGAAGFFPLFPLFVGLILQTAPALSFFWTGTTVSVVCTCIAMALMIQGLTRDEAHGRRALLITLAAAGSFYLSIPYTEGMFLLWVVLAMRLTRARFYLLAAVCCGLAAATRIHGFALVAVPAIARWEDRGDTVGQRVRDIVLIAVLAAGPVAAFMWHLSHVQGSAEAFIARQAMWDNALPYPLKALVGFVHFPTRLTNWVNGVFWFTYVGLLARNWRKMPPGEALFCAGALLISTQQETFHGIYRYVVPLVPLTLTLADERDSVRTAVIGLNLVVGAIMILAFVTHNRLVV